MDMRDSLSLEIIGVCRGMIVGSVDVLLLHNGEKA